MLWTILLSSTLLTILYDPGVSAENGTRSPLPSKPVTGVSSVQEEIKLIKQTMGTMMSLMTMMSQTVTSNSKVIEKYSAILHGFEVKTKEITTNSQAIERNSKTLHDVESKTKDIKSNSQAIERNSKTLQTKTKEITSLTKTVRTLTEHCDLLPQNICGPCRCVDDNRLPDKYFCNCQHLPVKRDCKQFHHEGFKTSGLYKIHQNSFQILQVFCDQVTEGGGWIVFQRRTDGSVKFYRNWVSYETGFGDLQNEFWLGNAALSSLTLYGRISGGNELRIELEDWERVKKYAKYSKFEVGSALTKYQLDMSGYSGNAGESMTGGEDRDNGQKFTTFDQDNDPSPYNCAIRLSGAWWYNHCGNALLNGKYYDYGQMGATYTGIHWLAFHDGNYPLKFTEMKIRRKG